MADYGFDAGERGTTKKPAEVLFDTTAVISGTPVCEAVRPLLHERLNRRWNDRRAGERVTAGRNAVQPIPELQRTCCARR